MTKKETRDAIRIMQAYVDGKTIEHKTSSEGHYEHVDYPAWNFSHDPQSYRVKPEPHYRPFKNAEEVMEAIKEHGDWVQYEGVYYRVVVFTNALVYFGSTEKGESFDEALDNHRFADGTPFGKLEEE